MIDDTPAQPLFHIATAADWAHCGHDYTPADFAREGFVHCSTRRQVIETANRLFRGRTDLLLLTIDTRHIDATIRYENLYGGSELYPHIYARLPRSSIVAVAALVPDADGRFDATALT